MIEYINHLENSKTLRKFRLFCWAYAATSTLGGIPGKDVLKTYNCRICTAIFLNIYLVYDLNGWEFLKLTSGFPVYKKKHDKDPFFIANLQNGKEKNIRFHKMEVLSLSSVRKLKIKSKKIAAWLNMPIQNPIIKCGKQSCKRLKLSLLRSHNLTRNWVLDDTKIELSNNKYLKWLNV